MNNLKRGDSSVTVLVAVIVVVVIAAAFYFGYMKRDTEKTNSDQPGVEIQLGGSSNQ